MKRIKMRALFQQPHGAALDRQPFAPQRDQGGLDARSAVDDDELRALEAAGVEVVEELAPGRCALAAHVPDGQQDLLAVAASTEMLVALLSMRTLMTVPSRISRTMSSPSRLRAHHASRATFTLRQARLTTSLPTAPWNSPNRARLTRRVLVPAR
jgi:hypothetical protein